MDLEASVVERLQKLRQWQLEQQERLLKQQQVQREMLTQKQDCIYKALELSIQELNFNEDTSCTNNLSETIENTETGDKNLVTVHESKTKENTIQMLNKNGFCVDQNMNNSFRNITLEQQSPRGKFIKEIINTESDVRKLSNGKIVFDIKDEIKFIITSPKKEQTKQFIDGVAPLPPDKIAINHSCIDDIPIPSPKKDFHTLLEEKLKIHEPLDRSSANLQNKVKKPFLKKGEGLSRYKLSQRSQPFTSTQSNSKYCKNESRSKKSAQYSKNVQLSKNTCTNVVQKHLSLKNIPLPKKKILSKSESNTSTIKLEDCINEMKNTIELNTSDFHSGTQKELEEVRIFELLEEKAENSSFCSTSSAVVAFLQQPLPFKIKNDGGKTENNVFNMKQITSINKTPKHQVYKCTSSKDTDTYCNFPPLINQNLIHNNVYKVLVEDPNKDNTSRTNEKRHILLRNEVESVNNQQNFCSIPVTENDNQVDVSLHVRFSEYNEYKTIGLTDTSSTSTESLVTKCFIDDKIWSDSSTSETSVHCEIPQPSLTMKNKIQELNHKTQKYKDIGQNSNPACNTDIYQPICHKEESEFSDTVDQTFNAKEDCILYTCSQNDLVSQKMNNSHNIETLKKHMEKCDNKIDEHINTCNDATVEDQDNKQNLPEINETIFKSDLLKNRLLELEQEINIFRKENTALSIERKKLQEQHRNLHKEYAEKEKKFEENKRQLEDRLQEERKKLAREKAALENRMRDSQEKAQQSKLERQEIQNLKQEIEKLTQEIHTKESRWNAAQSRHKCQMRILKMENSKLKQEVERLQNFKKNNVKGKGRPGASANTRAIHQISRQLEMQFKKSEKINTSSDDAEKLIQPMLKTISIIEDQNIEKEKVHSNSKSLMNEKSQERQTIVTKKRNLYENLIKEATLDLTENQEQFNVSENLSKLTETNMNNDNCKKSYEEHNIPFNYGNINGNIQLHSQSDQTCEENLISISSDKLSDKHLESTFSSCQNKTDIDKQTVKQIEHIDGSIEYQFPNGNIKKIFPDQGVTKLIYYNGDIRETNKDGKIKYFYASTHTWHTTMPDGLEILEFADGQIERRSHNGIVEVSFPDGSVRILESDGTEKWTLPDGTLIQILMNGEKILTLPNGQHEIHTKTHKRREYPDGTIKLIYPDGTQETRYSNGRIRLKDKDGNLLMDSYQ